MNGCVKWVDASRERYVHSMLYSCATKERGERRRHIASGDGPRLDMRRVSLLAAALLASWCVDCVAQNLPVPYEETFDAALPPALPAGWRSSTARSSGSSDFTCVTSSPNSPPCAVMATNATIEQWLATPPIDCRTGTPDRLTFAVRRSSTFGARCLVEASLDGGATFSLTIGDAPGPGSSASYVAADLPLPEMLAGQAAVVLRWRIIAESTGATGTFRMDDLRISVARPEIPPGTVVVNELQYQPSSGEPEWIELFNAGAEPIDLKGWTVSDASVTTSHRLSDIPQMIPPAGFVVVAADSVEFRAVWSGVHVMLLQSNGFPSLNNGGDLVLLRDAQGRCMDSVWYQQSWGGGMGVSIERIDPHSWVQSTQNWGGCRDSAGATPGRTNSIVIRDHDLLAGNLSLHSNRFPESVLLQASIHNAGRQASGPFTVHVINDVNRDSSGTGEEIVASASVPAPIFPKESLLVDLTWSSPSPGNHQMLAEILWLDDQRPENNTKIATIQVAIPRGTLCINEIHASPVGGTAEYVEVVNSSAYAVPLTGCWITDRPLSSGSVNRWPVSKAPRLLRPGELHVVAGDSAVVWWTGGNSGVCTVVNSTGLGLNNEGDLLILQGPDGSTLDSVPYASAWHSPNISDPAGRSLEKYSPQLAGTEPHNWGTCVHPSGGTPGCQNSILITSLPQSATLTCAPDPFSPDGDGVDDATIVRYQLPLRSALVRLKVFDIRGRCVRDLLNTDPAGTRGEAVWDGYDNNRRPLRIGIYILYLEAIDAQGGSIVSAKKAVVVARRL